MKNWFWATFLLTFISLQAYGASRRFIIIKQNQVLSFIAFKYLGAPVYTKSGSLKRLLGINPQIKNQNLIFPGEKIFLERTSFIVNQRQLASQSKSAILTKVGVPHRSQTSERVLHEVFYRVGFDFTTLAAHESATNTNANLYTSHDFNLGLGWQQQWSRRFLSFTNFSVRNLDFEPSTNPAKTLINTNQTLFGLSIGAQSRLNPKLSLRYATRWAQELFLHGVDTTTISVDSVAVPQLEIQAKWEWAHRDATTDGFFAGANYFFAASTDTYAVHAGTGFTGGVYLRHLTKSDHELDLALGYFQRNQNTSILQFNENGAFGELTYSLPLFEDDGANLRSNK